LVRGQGSTGRQGAGCKVQGTRCCWVLGAGCWVLSTFDLNLTNMKNYQLQIALLALNLIFTGCSQINEKDKTEAKQIYAECNNTAKIWLNELGKTGYSYLNNMKLSDLAKGQITEKLEAELSDYIAQCETTYGKVNERKFLGAHFWLHNSLLTYIPEYNQQILNRMGKAEAKDGFYRINPRFMGLSKSSDMFKSLPESDYVLLMYKSVPTSKTYAEEMVILAVDKNNTWQVVSYEISDDI
jgi:hypothetical protein